MSEPETVVGVTSDGRVFLRVPGYPIGLMTPKAARKMARNMRDRIRDCPENERAEILELADDLDRLATEVEAPGGSA